MKELFFTSHSQKDLKKLDSRSKSSIVNKLQKFRNSSLDAIPLTGTWKGWYKLRVGNYRILLTIQKKSWIVGYIRHRKEVYKN
ncbi:type II toxin-antitoxin system mRNA interferase toxin, RelE/StbE family [Candidatus Roizmanbacteria bacterium CG_4_9_14_0_2_um_filter_39_13]|uniref:Type II toxin-antitoxin system mRNA interferase toxin, RelE/StbE family n=2 Tax=Candidatus Roizmaniibacteriota TaxID=1752723 RepID=A0A2M8F084_9BACT|nr:MAG: type II toxin-antitoxin system mRNA interferase toxin, RelE/StbE family [Candidatus Roizmanbacteria bacterium CG_4_9_14_0_2_um_filter_39_13]PJE62216.1 MAG: type II toxin-antitoxin system mRNA interferase toxin, RelE/StbE family [Candidatus Roizmanbacteria bacterium CG10_big_fil_rev_8_21_14_0_10_39_12]